MRNCRHNLLVLWELVVEKEEETSCKWVLLSLMESEEEGIFYLTAYFTLLYFCWSYFFTGCDLIYIACRCLRCVQGEPRVSWWRALMTKAVLPSGTRYDIHSFKVSVMCEWILLFLHRMEDKGEVKCIKFSIGIKILAVQRTSKSVVRKLASCLTGLIMPGNLQP